MQVRKSSPKVTASEPAKGTTSKLGCSPATISTARFSNQVQTDRDQLVQIQSFYLPFYRSLSLAIEPLKRALTTTASLKFSEYFVLSWEVCVTLNAIATLRQEGYRVAIDGVTPDMLSYFNFTRFDVDAIKINVSKDYATEVSSDPQEHHLQVPREKIIFFHCDSEQALTAGIDLGVTKFQGWLIDDKSPRVP